jgi:hypothetical protein
MSSFRRIFELVTKQIRSALDRLALELLLILDKGPTHDRPFPPQKPPSRDDPSADSSTTTPTEDDRPQKSKQTGCD